MLHHMPIKLIRSVVCPILTYLLSTHLKLPSWSIHKAYFSSFTFSCKTFRLYLKSPPNRVRYSKQSQYEYFLPLVISISISFRFLFWLISSPPPSTSSVLSKIFVGFVKYEEVKAYCWFCDKLCIPLIRMRRGKLPIINVFIQFPAGLMKLSSDSSSESYYHQLSASTPWFSTLLTDY